MNEELMRCDACGAMVAVSGIKMQNRVTGEYVIAFFECPHCGERFLVSVTDEEQRERNRQLQILRRKKRIGIDAKYRLKTLQKYDRQITKLLEENEEHGKKLRKIGERLLAGAKEGDDDREGSEDSSGAVPGTETGTQTAAENPR